MMKNMIGKDCNVFTTNYKYNKETLKSEGYTEIKRMKKRKFLDWFKMSYSTNVALVNGSNMTEKLF